MRVLLTALLGLAVGCTDRSVDLSFEIPDAYRERVESISLRVLVPPDGASFSCDGSDDRTVAALAFGEVAADTIAAATFAEVTTEDGRISLGDVPREGTKLFWFEGRDAEGLAVTSACGELGVIDSEESLGLVGEPVSLVTAAPLNELGGAPFPQTITVIVGDVDANALEDADVRWSLMGPGGQEAEGIGTTDRSGRFPINPPPAETPGPAALTIRTRWNRTATPRFIAYEPAPIVHEGPLAGDPDRPLQADTADRYVTGRIGPAGEMGFAARGQPESAAFDKAITRGYWNGSSFVVSDTTPLVGVQVLSQITRGGREIPLGLARTEWIECPPPTLTCSSFSPPWSLSLTSRITKILPVGGCGEDETGYELLFVATRDDAETSSFFVVDANRQLVDTTPVIALTDLEIVDDNLIASGCVAGTSGEAHRTVFFTKDGSVRFVAFMDEVRGGILPLAEGSIGFQPAVGSGSARAIVTALSLSGASLDRHRLVPLGPGIATLETTETDPTPTVPLSTGGGDVDGDTLADVAGIIAIGGVRDETRWRLLISLGIEADGQRLVGLSEEHVLGSPRLWLFDFDEDGDDDILVGGSSAYKIFEMGSR